MTDPPTLPSTEAMGEVRRQVEQVLGDLDVEAIAEKWLRQCGSCDAGLPEYGCSHPAEDYRPTMLRLVEEVRRLRALQRPVLLFGHAYIWRDPKTGEEKHLAPQDVTIVLSADQVTEVEKLRSDLAAMTSELAEERTLHQQTIAERDRWKSRATKEHVQELTLERDQARADRDAMRPVVEAAKAWRTSGLADDDHWYAGAPASEELANAVDTYTNREASK